VGRRTLAQSISHFYFSVAQIMISSLLTAWCIFALTNACVAGYLNLWNAEDRLLHCADEFQVMITLSFYMLWQWSCIGAVCRRYSTE